MRVRWNRPAIRTRGRTTAGSRVMTVSQSAQLDFGSLLLESDKANANRDLVAKAAHLPASIDEALPYFRELVRKHHTAMLAADAEQVSALKEEAHLLATKLNGFEAGYLADDDAPGRV